nr:Sua5/YciO/YrdC/YwlC family protein [Angustibacter aerolatus]
MRRFDCRTDTGRDTGTRQAAEAVQRGEVVVLPTDTVYGVGADAFSPQAVQAVLDAKGRGRDMPPPVLVPNARTLDGLAVDLSDAAREPGVGVLAGTADDRLPRAAVAALGPRRHRRHGRGADAAAPGGAGAARPHGSDGGDQRQPHRAAAGDDGRRGRRAGGGGRRGVPRRRPEHVVRGLHDRRRDRGGAAGAACRPDRARPAARPGGRRRGPGLNGRHDAVACALRSTDLDRTRRRPPDPMTTLEPRHDRHLLGP